MCIHFVSVFPASQMIHFDNILSGYPYFFFSWELPAMNAGVQSEQKAMCSL